MRRYYTYRLAGKLRIARIIDVFSTIPNNLTLVNHWVTPLIKKVRREYDLFFNKDIGRYIVYKKIKDQWMKILVLDGSVRSKYINSNRARVEPGYWLYYKLKSMDLFRSYRAFDDYKNDFLAPSEGEKRVHDNIKEINLAMKKDFNMIGRTSVLFPKKIKYVGLKTGKVLGYG